MKSLGGGTGFFSKDNDIMNSEKSYALYEDDPFQLRTTQVESIVTLMFFFLVHAGDSILFLKNDPKHWFERHSIVPALLASNTDIDRCIFYR